MGTRNSEPCTKDGVKYSPVEADYQGILEMQGTGFLPEAEGHHKAQRHELEGLGR